MRLIIPFPTNSLNVFIGRHWSVKHNFRKKWINAIWISCFSNGNKGVPRTKTKKRIKINCYRNRLLDKDNFYGGLKPTIDAMKELEIIVDDSPKWLDLDCNQIKSKLSYTEIQIDDLNKPQIKIKEGRLKKIYHPKDFIEAKK